MSKGVADSFVEALHKLEEDEDDEALVAIHTDDCEVGNVSVLGTFRGHDGLLASSGLAIVVPSARCGPSSATFSPPRRVQREWTTEGTSDGDSVSYVGMSILEIEGDKVRRFMAYFDTRDLTPRVVD